MRIGNGPYRRLGTEWCVVLNKVNEKDDQTGTLPEGLSEVGKSVGHKKIRRLLTGKIIS